MYFCFSFLTHIYTIERKTYIADITSPVFCRDVSHLFFWYHVLKIWSMQDFSASSLNLNQWCGSALIAWGPGSTRFDECGSGSRSIKSPNWFNPSFIKSRKKKYFQICTQTLKISYFFRFRLEKYNFLRKKPPKKLLHGWNPETAPDGHTIRTLGGQIFHSCFMRFH